MNNATKQLLCCSTIGMAMVSWVAVPSMSHAENINGLPSRARPVPDVMYVPTPNDVAAEMLRLGGVCENDVVYDLGCGDGRIVVLAAKRYGCRAVGIDIDPLRVKDAQRNVREHHVEHLVTIKHGDLFNLDLGDATIVMLYLSTKYNTKLLPQLSAMKPGSRIVSHQFGIKGLKPQRIVSLSSQDGHEHNLRLWTVPLPVGPRYK